MCRLRAAARRPGAVPGPHCSLAARAALRGVAIPRSVPGGQVLAVQRLDCWRGGRRPANRVKLDTLGARAADNSGSPTRRGPMTREGCVRMDAARVSAVFALLLTALASENCGRAKREPAAPPPPPASLVRVGTLRVG